MSGAARMGSCEGPGQYSEGSVTHSLQDMCDRNVLHRAVLVCVCRARWGLVGLGAQGDVQCRAVCSVQWEGLPINQPVIVAIDLHMGGIMGDSMMGSMGGSIGGSMGGSMGGQHGGQYGGQHGGQHRDIIVPIQLPSLYELGTWLGIWYMAQLRSLCELGA